MLAQFDISSQRDRFSIALSPFTCTPAAPLQLLTKMIVSIYLTAVGALVYVILHVWVFANGGGRRYQLASPGELAVLRIYFVSVTIAFLSSAW
jgi:hypothetical protein